jgi:hypothetical protein
MWYDAATFSLMGNIDENYFQSSIIVHLFGSSYIRGSSNSSFGSRKIEAKIML